MNYEQEQKLLGQYRAYGCADMWEFDDLYPEWKKLRMALAYTDPVFARLRTAPAWTDPDGAIRTIEQRFELRFEAEEDGGVHYQRTDPLRVSASSLIEQFAEVKTREDFCAVLVNRANIDAITWLNNNRPGLSGWVSEARKAADRRTRTIPDSPVLYDAERLLNIGDILTALASNEPCMRDHPLTKIVKDGTASMLLKALVTLPADEAEHLCNAIADAQLSRIVGDDT